jgi:hypothetical protein
MPHYEDGAPAAIGDQVYGKLYNTPGVRAGTIVSITPGVDSCNCMVQFQVSVPVDEDGKSTPPRMRLAKSDGTPLEPRRTRSEQHGSSGPEIDVYDCVDYCAIKELTKVGP